jgi:hypothetical protein
MNCKKYTEVINERYLINKKASKLLFKGLKSCRGRDRTSTRQLAAVQSSVVDPGRTYIAANTALCCVYPVILTLETRGHVCQKFHHPTINIPICIWVDNANLYKLP